MFSSNSHIANSIKQGMRLECLPGGAPSTKYFCFCDSESGFPRLLPHLTSYRGFWYCCKLQIL